MAETETGKTYQVHGRVMGKHGRAVHRAKVVVWWQHIRFRRQLAVGETNRDGYYRLRYPIPEHFPGKVLIVVGASSMELGRPLESDLVEAQPVLCLDLARGGALLRVLASNPT